MDRKRRRTAGLAVVGALALSGGLGSVVFGADGSETQGGGSTTATPAAPAFRPAQDSEQAPRRGRHRGPCHKGEGTTDQATPAPSGATPDV
jgi:hypothetical protein